MSLVEKKGDANHTFTVGSLFAGIGGFCRAFKNAGFRVSWANENDPYAVATYKHNFPDVKLYEQSIEELAVHIHELTPVDVLTAGFPCQPFSVAGNKRGFNDARGNLFFHIIRLIKEFDKKDRPKIIVLENVKNLIHHDKGRTFSRIAQEIRAADYWFGPNNYRVLNTRNHTEIPQNRERVFMVAASMEHFDINDIGFPAEASETNDVKQYLDLDVQAEPEYYFPEDSKYGKMFIESIENGNPDSIYLLRRYYVRENRSDSVFTLTANMGGGGHNVPVIKDDWGIRKLTPRECLRLQGFKDDEFSFPPSISKSQQYKQIGNAVTVDLVEKIAQECMRKLKEVRL